MPKIHISLTDELHAELKERAESNRRSLQREVVLLLERGMRTVEVPVIGTIKDGVITIEEAATRG